MSRSLAVLLLSLPCATAATLTSAEEKAAPLACAAEEVCAEGNAPPVATGGGKHIWANRRLFTDAPALEVGKWLTEKPEMEGKFIVLEFWRTWCGACKRMTPLMNELQKKYGAELVVVGITGESEATVSAFKGPKKEYYLALDRPQPSSAQAGAEAPQAPAASDDAPLATLPDQAAGPSKNLPGQGVYEAAFGVWGWPHVIILEPQHRTVVWEGFTGLKGYELTEAKIEKMLAIGRAMKEEQKAKQAEPTR